MRERQLQTRSAKGESRAAAAAAERSGREKNTPEHARTRQHSPTLWRLIA